MKRVSDTSRSVFRELAPGVTARRLFVLAALRAYRLDHRTDPTSYELLRFVQSDDPTLDVNAIRPRLTELKDAGQVETTGKRRCTVTQKIVFTWAPAPPRTISAHAISESHNTEPVQERLL